MYYIIHHIPEKKADIKERLDPENTIQLEVQFKRTPSRTPSEKKTGGSALSLKSAFNQKRQRQPSSLLNTSMSQETNLANSPGEVGKNRGGTEANTIPSLVDDN